MTDWKLVQGSQVEKPREFDTTSSESIVYQRRNITQIEVGEEKTKMWEYEERKLTKDEYQVVANEVLMSKIDYVAMMTDVEI